MKVFKFLKIKTNLEKIQKIGQGALKEQEKDYPDPYFIRILKLEFRGWNLDLRGWGSILEAPRVRERPQRLARNHAGRPGGGP